MTYGEAHIVELESVQLIKGEFVKTRHIAYKPNPMNRVDAVKYYNTKFYKYWCSVLDTETPNREKLNKAWVKIQMFGSLTNTKLLKD